MQSVYVDKDIPRIIMAKALGPIWPDVVFSPLSPAHFAKLDDGTLPGPRWVRVENTACGICGSDITLLFTDVDLGISPAALPTGRFYLGHEVVGRISEVGPGVTKFKVGDRVTMDTRFQGPTCLSQEITPPCPQCTAGNYMRCENAAIGKGVQGWGGGWSDSFVAHESELYAVPNDITDDQAIMIEPFSVGVRAALRKLPKAGEQALILGTGIVGLNVLQAVRALSPECKITCVTRYPHQAALAKKLGADAVIGREDQNEAVARITQAKVYKGPLNNVTLLGGYDVIYDCVGSAATLKSSLRWAKAGGAVEIVGIDMHPLTVDLSPIWHQEVDLIGTYTHGSEVVNGAPHHTYETVIDLIHQKKLVTEGLITHRFPLTQWKDAVKTAMDKKTGSIKVVLECNK